MKKCPTCNRTYSDDALSFCLDDGAPLLTVSSTPSSFDPGATIHYPEARSTTPPTEVYRPGPPPASGSEIVNPSWAAIPGASATATPRKKSSLLPWIIGGSVVLVLLGIGVVVLLAVLVSLNSNSNNGNSNNSNKSNRNSGSSLTNANNSNNANGSSSSSPAMRDDFTDAKWLTGNFPNGSLWYQNGEYHMRSLKDRNIAMYAPDKSTYYTKDSTVRVTVRSVSGSSPTYGYGISVLAEMTKKYELADYSFLIYTGEDPQYKVVQHKDSKQTAIVNWTKTSTIRTGTSPNQLEVRLKGDQMSFYINGQYATSVKDTAGYKDGVVGFFTSDAHEVAFDDLEISR